MVFVTSIDAVNLDIVTLIFCLRLCCVALWIRNFNSLLLNTYNSHMWWFRLERKVPFVAFIVEALPTYDSSSPLNYIVRARDSIIRRWLNYFLNFTSALLHIFACKKKMINQKRSLYVRVSNSRKLLGIKPLNCCRMIKEKTTDSAL